MEAYLRNKLQVEIMDALKQCIKGLTNPDEPAYIAALVNQLPSHLEAILNHTFPTLNFKVGGCFLHQKPIAEFCEKKSLGYKKDPEIGDLLIVYKKIRGTEVTYNALLLQAKKLNGNTDSIYHHKIGYNDKHQLFLYTHWPKFIYRRANNLNGKKRSVIPKTITAGAQYLLIDKNAVCTPFWCAMPNNILVASKCLASQLVDFIEFQTGRTFVKSAPKDSWSQMIWDLLKISFQSVFNKPKYGYVKASRASDGISDFLDLPQKLTLSDNDDNNDVGIPILCIQSKEKEDNDELK